MSSVLTKSVKNQYAEKNTWKQKLVESMKNGKDVTFNPRGWLGLIAIQSIGQSSNAKTGRCRTRKPSETAGQALAVHHMIRFCSHVARMCHI